MSHDLQICDRNSIDSFLWPDEVAPFRPLLTDLVSNPVEEYFANCNTEFKLCRLGEYVLPITINNEEYENCYVCSPYAGAISYPLYELHEIDNRALRGGLAGLVHSIAPILRSACINRVVCVNNWMLSTNLYPHWNGEGLADLTRELIARYPTHAILFRSLNEATNQSLCDQFRRSGYLMAPSRQVYMFDDPESKYLRRNNCKWDLRLLTQRTDYETIMPNQIGSDCDSRIKRLYDMLYLEKYTPLNPHFTERLIQQWRESNAFRLYGLRSPQGTLDGIAGCFERGGVMTTPLVGYDTSLPRELGLYRMLITIVLQEAAKRQISLNLSSGASGFKRLRGAEPYIEYTAIYCEHLSRYRRMIWKTLSGLLTHVGARVLRELKL